LHFLELPLSLPYKPHLRTRVLKSSYTGVHPRRIDRLCFGQGRAFRRKLQKPAGGTVLVDLSGSMGSPEPIVDWVLQHRPADTVAGYAGSGLHVDRHYGKGSLAILAKGGRCVDFRASRARKLLGGRNIVDGPALLWLGQQSPPRFWLSDGYVTGIGESQAQALLVEADMICRRYGITRLDPETVGCPRY
jgi:hypothetical protein